MFHFTIQDVLWLTVVVALAVGWWVERRQASNKLREREEIWSQSHQRERQRVDDLSRAIDALEWKATQ